MHSTSNKTISPYHLSLIFSLSISFLFVFYGWLALAFSTLSTTFLLSVFNNNLKNKILSSLLFLIVVFLLGYFTFAFGSYVAEHIDELFNIESSFVQNIYSFLKIQQPKNFDINYVFKFFLNYIKSNIGILFSFGANSLQIIVGILFGFLFFFHKEKNNNLKTYWGEFVFFTKEKMVYFFEAFSSVLKLQLTISIMNIFSLSILCFIIAPTINGNILPYWYILLPLVGILSLIPVIGNLFVNVLIFVISINISFTFMIVSIVYFFIIHKIELLTIGTIVGKKNEVPFLYVSIGMLLGELIFHSMLGVLFGVIFLVFFKNILTSKKYTYS